MELDLAKYIDHTALKPDTTADDIDKLNKEAQQFEFASVCINPYWVKKSAQQLYSTSVKVCSVIGFPLGATSVESKVLEAKQAIQDGASEVDMVINIGELKAGNNEAVKFDIAQVIETAGDDVLVKVILETSLLNDEEKVIACQLAKQAGADFVKTSTGFSGGGATVEDIRLMRETVGPDMGIKASGGIRNRQTALSMIEAGATRLGASAGVSIVKNEE